MHAQVAAILLLVGTLAGPGCTGPEGNELRCPPHGTWGRITSHDNDTLEIVLMDFSPAVLHAGDAQVFQQLGTECHEAEHRHLEPGREIGFEPGAWGESYPPQAWPNDIVLLG